MEPVELHKSKFCVLEYKHPLYVSFREAFKSLYKKLMFLSYHEPTFNSFLPACDVFEVSQEMIHCNWLALQCHDFYCAENERKDDSAHVGFSTNLYISDVFYRIATIYDKIIFSYVSCISYKDPEKKYEGWKFIEELETFLELEKENHPLSTGIEFCLNMCNKKEWNKIKRFRDQESHRLDPKIGAYNITKVHGWPYSKRMTEKEAIQEAVAEYKSTYNQAERLSHQREYFEKWVKTFKDFHAIDGHYYKIVHPSWRMESFDTIQADLDICISDLMEAGRLLFEGLAQCPPYNWVDG